MSDKSASIGRDDGLMGMWVLAFWWAPNAGILATLVAPYEHTINVAFAAAIGICLVAAVKSKDVRLASVLNAAMALLLFVGRLFLVPIAGWLMPD